MHVNECYYERLSQFLSTDIIVRETGIIISDGNDIHYSLEKMNDEFYLTILERGREQFRRIFLTERLAWLYFPFFVKRSLKPIQIDNIEKIQSIENIMELQNFMESEGLEEYFSINQKSKGKINFIEVADRQLRYQGNDGSVYPIPYLKNRVKQNFYISTIRYRTMKKWLQEFKELFEISLSDEEETILLGYKSPFTT